MHRGASSQRSRHHLRLNHIKAVLAGTGCNWLGPQAANIACVNKQKRTVPPGYVFQEQARDEAAPSKVLSADVLLAFQEIAGLSHPKLQLTLQCISKKRPG